MVTESPLHWAELGLSPIAFEIGPFAIRWYALAFLVSFLIGRWYLMRLLREDHAPMQPETVDDLMIHAILGIILGGRLGYAAFYQPSLLISPAELVTVWKGGMSFHGGLIGLLIGLWLFARRFNAPLLRVIDYVGCATPFGVALVRLANFVNGELWGRPTDLPWGMVFPDGGPLARHPSQLYEALFEGVGLMILLGWLFWKTDLRQIPGRLAGAGLVWYALARGAIETVRQPDAGLEHLPLGLTMGQYLSLPILLGGLYLLLRRTEITRPAAPRADTTPPPA
jgi:phosphatidylglycerol:prolipoprotein diacylglycerol transferase